MPTKEQVNDEIAKLNAKIKALKRARDIDTLIIAKRGSKGKPVEIIDGINFYSHKAAREYIERLRRV